MWNFPKKKERTKKTTTYLFIQIKNHSFNSIFLLDLFGIIKLLLLAAADEIKTIFVLSLFFPPWFSCCISFKTLHKIRTLLQHGTQTLTLIFILCQKSKIFPNKIWIILSKKNNDEKWQFIAKFTMSSRLWLRLKIDEKIKQIEQQIGSNQSPYWEKN